MRGIRDIVGRLRSLAHRRAFERDFEEEIRFHLDEQTEKHVRAGMSRIDARRQALVKFGSVERARQSTRDEVRLRPFDDAGRDLRYAVRALRRGPAFTAVASLTLALGIGATVSVFSVINGVLIKPLPYPRPERLVALWQSAPGANFPEMYFTAATQFFTYRDKNRSFQEIGLWSTDTASVSGSGEPEQVRTLLVTHGTLEALDVLPDRGRWFSLADDTPGSPETAILTYGYWQRRYGGAESVMGRAIMVDSRPRQIIGVMPKSFRFLDQDPELILPFRFDRQHLFIGSFNFHALARLRPDVSTARAAADLRRMIPIWLRSWPSPPGFDAQMWEKARFSPSLRPLKRDVVGDVGGVLWILMATVGTVLLIACANTANLLLVRAEVRQRELAVRAALGAGWGRIARELLIESLVLASIGGILGLGLAFAAVRLLEAIGPATLPRLNEIRIDPRVVAFTAIVSLLSGCVFGVIPVIRQAGPHISGMLRGSDRTSTATRERHRTRNTLAVVQIALALVMLVAAGLMIRTLAALHAVRPGFTEPEQVQLARITIPQAQDADPEAPFRMQAAIRDRLAAIPGVAAVSFANRAPTEPDESNDMVLAEDRKDAGGGIQQPRRYKFVAPGFFRTVGTPVLAGRDFTWTDLQTRRPVAIVSENLARELWGTPSAALGKRIRENRAEAWREIVGVVGDVYDDGVHERAPTIAYWPVLMEGFWGNRVLVQRSVTFALRSSRTGSEAFAEDVRQAVWAVNANLPVIEVHTLANVYARSLARTSFTLVMLTIAAAIALLLGVVGVYGVISFAVTQRTREIGVRLALGARPGELKRMLVRYGLALSATGLVCGAGAAFALGRLMTSLLFGISALDPVTYAAVSLILVSAAALASYLPARKAIAVDPVQALRSE